MKEFVFAGVLFYFSFSAWVVKARSFFDTTIRPAAALTQNYCPKLKGKRVALIINQASKVGDSSLLDILMVRGIKVVKIFVPEHGFRGREDAGAKVDNTVDSATGLSVISLYGSHKKPVAADLKDVDVMVYDLQDVGARFYTYISTLEYCMEASAEEKKQFMVLDRPNPNGFYVDGPVLDTYNKSFVGMQPIPVVYGMTAGEYAMMLKGENWLKTENSLDLSVIKCFNYDHKKRYKLPVAPSPNLRTMAAIYAYPSLCLFEGTKISVGRGTALPFQQYGCPEFEGKFTYSFVPKSGEGAKSPMYEGKQCYGEITGETPESALKNIGGGFQLNWLLRAYEIFPEKEKFFNAFFLKLAGTSKLEQQIRSGTLGRAIRVSWLQDIKAFKKIRRKYLLYPDFE